MKDLKFKNLEENIKYILMNSGLGKAFLGTAPEVQGGEKKDELYFIKILNV